MKNRFMLAIALVFVGCVCVSPDQAVNISEVHDGIVRLMPHAEASIRAQIAEQTAIVNSESVAQSERDAAAAKVVELHGQLLEVLLLPQVSEPIRDWAVAKVGTDDFLAAKQRREEQIEGGSRGSR